MDKFVKATLIRAIKTIAQSMIATIGTTQYFGAVDWKIVFSASALAGILSLLTSITMGLPEVEEDV